MKRSAGITLGFCLFAVTAIADNEKIPFDSDRWEIEAEEWRIEEYLGQSSLFLKGGTAVIKDSTFTDGIIEFDIAFPEDRNFVGAMWRFQGEENFEDFYIRPHQSGNPDANQYTPVFNGLSGWQLYHGEGYAAPTEYRFNEWLHVKIVIAGSQGEIYIGEGEEPAIVMHELKHPVTAGKVGLKAGVRADTHYANFTFQAVADPPLKVLPKQPEPAPAGTVKAWSVSSSFAESDLEGQYDLADSLKNGLSWEVLDCESTGLANLARIQGVTPEANTAFAKITIVSDRAQVKRMKFGFSDSVKAYLNGRLVFSGTDTYQSRDYRFLGTVGFFDELYLPLEEGENEFWMAVSESFGGWGIKAKFEDTEGIEIR